MTLDVSHNQLELIPQGMFEIVEKRFNVSCAIVRVAHLAVCVSLHNHAPIISWLSDQWGEHTRI